MLMMTPRSWEKFSSRLCVVWRVVNGLAFFCIFVLRDGILSMLHVRHPCWRGEVDVTTDDPLKPRQPPAIWLSGFDRHEGELVLAWI